MSKKKKIIILATMFVLLVATGYLNIVLNKNATINTGGNNVTTGNFFVTYKVDRQSIRDNEKTYYEAIMASPSSSAEAKASAKTKIENLAANMEMELITEMLIKSVGFEDVIITNSASCINVIVKSDPLTSSEVARIVSIIMEQAKIGEDNITIIPVK